MMERELSDEEEDRENLISQNARPNAVVKSPDHRNHRNHRSSFQIDDDFRNRMSQRAAVGDPKTEAVTKAKLLIAEAEKAAKALEVASKTSPLAHASLMESRMLIAEAHKLIESIEIEDATAFIEDYNESNLSEAVPLLENEQSVDLKSPKKVNGVHSIPSDLEENDSFSFDEFIFADFINGNGSTPYPLEIEEIEPNGFASSVLDNMMNGSGSTKNRVDPKLPSPNGVSVRRQKPAMDMPDLRPEKVGAAKIEAKMVRKWVRGRLVEVDEEEEEQAAA